MTRRKLSTDWTACEPRRICLIKPSAFGDVVQTLPLLPVLRERYPEAQISWVISRSLKDLVSNHSCLDEWIPFDRRGGWSGWKQLLRTLRERKFDLVFDLQGLLRSAVMTLATKAKWRIGLQTAREGSSLVCHRLIPDSSNAVPAHARGWRIAELLGLGDRPRTTEIHIPGEDRHFITQQLRTVSRPVMAVHSGARWVTKRWPLEKFAEVCRRAIHEFGMSVVLVGSPDERSQSEELAALLPENSVENFTGKTSLKQLAGLLEKVDVVLSNDSGPMHLAAGMGTPVVGIFTCTSPVRSGPPVGEHCPPHQLVATQLECAAGYHKQCPLRGGKHLACFAELEVERVWQALCRVMNNLQQLPRSA